MITKYLVIEAHTDEAQPIVAVTDTREKAEKIAYSHLEQWLEIIEIEKQKLEI